MIKFIEFGGQLIKRAEVSRAAVTNEGNKKNPRWAVKLIYYDGVTPASYVPLYDYCESEREAQIKLKHLHLDLEE